MWVITNFMLYPQVALTLLVSFCIKQVLNMKLDFDPFEKAKMSK